MKEMFHTVQIEEEKNSNHQKQNNMAAIDETKGKCFLYLKRNRILGSLTVILFVMVLLIIKYCDIPILLPEKYFGILICDPEGDKLWYNIGISYAAAYIFYIIQVDIPARRTEKRAYRMIRKQLSKVLRSVKVVRYLFDNMIEFDSDGDIGIKNSCWFYEESFYDSYLVAKDYAFGRNEIDGKMLRKAKKSCLSISELSKTVESCCGAAEQLQNNKYYNQIDQNIYDLIEELDLVGYCKGLISVLYITERMDSLQGAIQLETLRAALKDIKGLSVTMENNNIFFLLSDGCKKEYNGKMKRVPFHTGIRESNVKIDELIKKIELVCNVDIDISFRELTPQEEQEVMSHEPMNRAIEKVLSR